MVAKRNILKIPKAIKDRLGTFGDEIIVACAKRLKSADIPRYAHLGLKIESGKLLIPPPAMPPPGAGRYSKANVEGKEIIRDDLPKVTKTYSWDTPNWGDWSNGYHTHHRTREVYQRDFIRPKEVELSVTLLSDQADGNEFYLKFSVEQVLSRRAPDFEDELLYNLNILQENIGAADVFPSAATLADYSATIRVDWEILPPGEVGEIVERMLRGKRPVTPDLRKQMEARLKVMARSKPQNYIAGTNGFLRYFGAKFEDNIVAFENLTYGNALYVMYDNWEELSRRSRIDLLKGPRDGFDRIEHREGWDGQFRALLDRKRNPKPKKFL